MTNETLMKKDKNLVKILKLVEELSKSIKMLKFNKYVKIRQKVLAIFQKQKLYVIFVATFATD